MWAEARRAAAMLGHGAHPIQAFHWELEFPEVFEGRTVGFDAIVGNPPFLGGTRISRVHGDAYSDWLQTLHLGAHGNADLVAHFFRRAFALLRSGGCLGLIATNTVGQGDTRETGLCQVIGAGGTIARAVRRLPWPGDAAVVVSVVHVVRDCRSSPSLDGRQVKRISAYLVEGDLDGSPSRLLSNTNIAFSGVKIYSSGFTFDDAEAAKGNTPSLEEMHDIISRDQNNSSRIFPYLGGSAVSSSPSHAHYRYCIDFANFPLWRDPGLQPWARLTEAEKGRYLAEGVVPADFPGPVAADWPDLLAIVSRWVKPSRDKESNPRLRKFWWQFEARRPALYAAIGSKQAVLGITQTSPHLSVSRLPTGCIYDQKIVVVADDSFARFGLCQARLHEIWARAFSASMKDDLSYTPTDSFQTFPFQTDFERNDGINDHSPTYHTHRAALMVARNEGLTKTYNRFHNPADRAPDIQRLRELHHELDLAVLRAYGWDDLAARAAPEFLTEETEPDHRYQGRLFWPAPFRDEVLARLLDLNRARAAEERALGLSPSAAPADEETEDA